MAPLSQEDEFDKVAFAPSLGEEIAKKFGADTVAQMNDIGFNFDARIDSWHDPRRWGRRINRPAHAPESGW